MSRTIIDTKPHYYAHGRGCAGDGSYQAQVLDRHTGAVMSTHSDIAAAIVEAGRLNAEK